jgi:hypothetical protein
MAKEKGKRGMSAKVDNKAKGGAKHTQAKKLKVRKLEERIAPSMIGGGMVDPGAIDVPDDQMQEPVSSQEPLSSTQVETVDSGQPPADGSDGNFTDAKADTSSMDAQDQQSQEFNNEADQGYQDLNQEQAADQGYVEEAQTWREPDWVTANADGSVVIAPPEGVSIDNGIASFPVDVANAELPVPEGVEFQDDGSVKVVLPEDAQFNETANTVIVQSDCELLQAVPEGMDTYPNPDGTVSVALPEQGVNFDADTKSLTFDNSTVNEYAPSNLEVQEDGTVAVTLPEDAEVQADGSVFVPADATELMDHPPAEYMDDLSWADVNSDGSVSCEVPEGANLDDGVLTISNDALSDTLPIPEDITINADGSLEVQVPEGTVYNADVGSLTFPEGQVRLEEIPDGVEAHVNPDGTITAMLPEGMKYDADAGSVHMDNQWANEFAPDTVAINSDGSVSVLMPEGTQFDADGDSFTIPAEQSDFMNDHSPDYVHDVDYSVAHGDGSYTVTPPEGVQVADGQMQIPYDHVSDYAPLPEGTTINTDGSMDVKLPAGAQYDVQAGVLTLPPGEFKMDDVPDGIEANVNTDGSVSVTLPDGIDFDPASGSVHFDNYWANEVMPAPVEITPEGALNVTLPDSVEYHQDGSFTIPDYSSDFIDNSAPDYVMEGPEWVSMNPDGSVLVQAYDGVQVDPQSGTMSMSVDTCQDQFKDHIPDDVQMNSDGTMDVQLPQGSAYNADAGTLTFPAGAVHVNEIPDGLREALNPTLNADGTLSVTLPDGMSFNAEAGAVHMDNYWTNEAAPENVEISQDGQVMVDLPPDCQHYSDGSFSVPPVYADYIDSPPPVYVTEGPEWVSANQDGSVTFQPPADVQIDYQSGSMKMDVESFNEHYENYGDQDFTLNQDGTADLKCPEGTTFDAASGTLHFEAGQVHMNEIPEGIDAQLNDDGSISVKLPEGIDYSADANSVHLSNQWVNELAPEPVQISVDGQMQVYLPPETQYFPDQGACVIPAGATEFMQPDYQAAQYQGDSAEAYKAAS